MSGRERAAVTRSTRLRAALKEQGWAYLREQLSELPREHRTAWPLRGSLVRSPRRGALMEWKVHGRRMPYTSDWVSVELADVELPDGRRFEHHVLRIPRHSVTVVVTDDQGRVLLLWRHRFTIDRWGWEVPAGWADAGEPPERAARREVEEETGWRPGPLRRLCSYYALPGISDQAFTVFHAHGATYQGPPPDRSEASRVAWVPLASLKKLVAEGLLSDGPSLTALSFALAFPPG